MFGVAEIRVKVDDDTHKTLETMAERLATTPETLVENLIDVVASYGEDLMEWGLNLRVKRENRALSLFEELIFYGVEAWRGIVDKVLSYLHARGRFELEELEFDPIEPSIEMEFAALEGSDFKVDRLRVNWSRDSVIVEAYYYLEEDEEPPHIVQPEGFEVLHLPDENAVVITAIRSSLENIPPMHVFDKILEEGWP